MVPLKTFQGLRLVGSKYGDTIVSKSLSVRKTQVSGPASCSLDLPWPDWRCVLAYLTIKEIT